MKKPTMIEVYKQDSEGNVDYSKSELDRFQCLTFEEVKARIDWIYLNFDMDECIICIREE